MKLFADRQFRPAVFALLTVVILAGCGGEDSAEESSTSQTGTSGATTGTGGATTSTGGGTTSTGTGGTIPNGGTTGTPPGAGTSGASATRSVELSWTPPAEYEDGSPFFDVGGYRLRFGLSPGVYTRVLDVRPDRTSVTVTSLKATTYYFALTAYNNAGTESALSNELAITLN